LNQAQKPRRGLSALRSELPPFEQSRRVPTSSIPIYMRWVFETRRGDFPKLGPFDKLKSLASFGFERFVIFIGLFD